MHEESKTPWSFYLVVGSAAMVVLGVVGFFVYLNWGKWGLPDPEEFVKDVQESHTGEVTGAVVVEGNAANFMSYVNREDVMVVVNIYHHFDEFNEDLRLDIKRLSARHEGRVILMNVDARRRPAKLPRGLGGTPDVRLMHGGEQLGAFTGKDLVWEVEEMVKVHKKRLTDPVRQAASETSPYGESLQTGPGREFSPKGITPQ